MADQTLLLDYPGPLFEHIAGNPGTGPMWSREDEIVERSTRNALNLPRSRNMPGSCPPFSNQFQG